MNFNLSDRGKILVVTFITLLKKPGMYVPLLLSEASKLFSATYCGDFAASLPHKPCPLICSLMSSRVGIAPGNTAVTDIPFVITSSRRDNEKDVNADFVAL